MREKQGGWNTSSAHVAKWEQSKMNRTKTLPDSDKPYGKRLKRNNETNKKR